MSFSSMKKFQKKTLTEKLPDKVPLTPTNYPLTKLKWRTEFL